MPDQNRKYILALFLLTKTYLKHELYILTCINFFLMTNMFRIIYFKHINLFIQKNALGQHTPCLASGGHYVKQTLCNQSFGRRRINSVTGLINVFTYPWSDVFTSIFLTRLSLLGNLAVILAMGQLFHATCLSLSRNRSPTWRFLGDPVHFCLSCNVSRYSHLQRG